MQSVNKKWNLTTQFVVCQIQSSQGISHLQNFIWHFLQPGVAEGDDARGAPPRRAASRRIGAPAAAAAHPQIPSLSRGKGRRLWIEGG